MIIQNWKNLFFLHFSIEPTALKACLPGEIEIDLYNNKAYLAIVGFEMQHIRFKKFPFLHYPSFFELNLRTYIKLPDGRAAIYFFSLDANSKLSVIIAQKLFKLPYQYYNIEYAIHHQSGNMRSFEQERIVNDIHFTISVEQANDPLAFFLLERYHFMTKQKGSFYVGSLTHVPYAAVRLKSYHFKTHLFERFSINEKEIALESNGCYYCPGFDVTVTDFYQI